MRGCVQKPDSNGRLMSIAVWAMRTTPSDQDLPAAGCAPGGWPWQDVVPGNAGVGGLNLDPLDDPTGGSINAQFPRKEECVSGAYSYRPMETYGCDPVALVWHVSPDGWLGGLVSSHP